MIFLKSRREPRPEPAGRVSRRQLYILLKSLQLWNYNCLSLTW